MEMGELMMLGIATVFETIAERMPRKIPQGLKDYPVILISPEMMLYPDVPLVWAERIKRRHPGWYWKLK